VGMGMGNWNQGALLWYLANLTISVAVAAAFEF